MDTPTTALSRVEAVLQEADRALFLDEIARQAEVEKDVAQYAIRKLHACGMIETVHTQGKRGNRYAWLAAKPLPKVATPEAPAGQPETSMNAGHEPSASADSGQKNETELAAHAPPTFSVAGEPGPELVETSNKYAEAFTRLLGRIENPRYLVLVPKRKPRIVKSRARAEALALAAVRNGAKDAQVFALTAIGRARRGAEWVETTA